MKRVADEKVSDEATIAEKTESYAKRYPQLVGIRGWLILFLLGIVASVIANLYSSLLGFSDQTMYTDTVLSQYPALPGIITFENFAQILVAIGGIVLIVMIMRRDKSTVRFAGVYFTAILVYSLIILILGYILFGSNSLVLSAAFKGGGQIRAAIYSSVWLAYFLSSNRVKATFEGTKNIPKTVTSQNINTNKVISPIKFEKQLDALESMAGKLDKGCREGQVPDEIIKKAQRYVAEVGDEITDSKSIADRAYIVYEVQALLLWIQHDEDGARELTKIAVEAKGDDILFTQTANTILRS